MARPWTVTEERHELALKTINRLRQRLRRARAMAAHQCQHCHKKVGCGVLSCTECLESLKLKKVLGAVGEAGACG